MKSAFASYEKDAYPNRFRIEILHARYMREYLATHPKQRRAAVQRSRSNRLARRKAGR